MPRQVGIGGDSDLDGRETKYDLTRHRPFIAVFSVWFLLVCGCLGDPSLLLSPGTAGGEPVAWQRVEYQPISPSRFQVSDPQGGSSWYDCTTPFRR